MKNRFRFEILLAICLLVIFMSSASVRGQGPTVFQGGFVGSDRCAACHQIQYKGWVKTFHSTVIQDAREHPEAILGDFTDPDLPFKKEDVWYTIGGHWDQRYLTKIDDDFYVLPRLWSVQSRSWRPYSTWAWKKRPYSKYCAGCHSVAYDPENKIYIEHTIGCEACHGPGRAHVNSSGMGKIVNPEKLSDDLADMVCASCHVRGKDKSGQYFYPVGYVPGYDLSKHLVPLEKKEGESAKESILRLWKKWEADREAQARSRCEVCGIHQKNKSKGNGRDVNSVCLGCHEFGENLEKHTRHRPDVEISCSDCHKQKVNPVNQPKQEDVHSYSYFLVHPLNCWDKRIYLRCATCHVQEDIDWGYERFLEWTTARETDH
jgi:hypothetical protein